MMEEHSATPMFIRISESTGGLLTSSIESLARISLGQTVLKMMDRMLWVVEKSVQWSLPPQEMAADENGKCFGEIELVRPLPWVFFLPTLIFLRLLKTGVNAGASIFGFPEIQPSAVVKFLQKRRRQLRTVKNNGLRNMRVQKMLEEKDTGLERNEIRKTIIRSIQLTLSSLSCLDNYRSSPSPPPEPMRVTKNNFVAASSPFDEKPILSSATNSPRHGDFKRKHNEVAPHSSTDEDSNQSDEETLVSKVDRLASEDSIDDPDFDPGDYVTSDATTDASFEDEEVLLTEAKELIEDAKNNLPSLIGSLEERKIVTAPESVQKAKPNLMLENSDARQGGEFSEGRESYYSPNNFGTDGELMTFYSPISSKSVSPERSNSPTKSQLKGSNAKSGDLGNGEVKAKKGPISSENDISRVSRKDVTNGNGHVEGKKSANSGKYNQKRRTSHGNRKKK